MLDSLPITTAGPLRHSPESPWHIWEDVRPYYGIHTYNIDGQKVAGISVPSWDDFLNALHFVRPDTNIIVSPELITVADVPWGSRDQLKEVAEQRLMDILRLSGINQSITYLIGTPFFDLGEYKPTNSVVAIRDRQIIGSTNKRFGADVDEMRVFRFPRETPAFTIPGTSVGLLICADFNMSHLFAPSAQQPLSSDTLSLLGHSDLVGRNLRLIGDYVTSVVMVSCWGVGSQVRKLPIDPNVYYMTALRSTAGAVVDAYPKISAIVSVDRAPVGASGVVSTIPFNARFMRSFSY